MSLKIVFWLGIAPNIVLSTLIMSIINVDATAQNNNNANTTITQIQDNNKIDNSLSNESNLPSSVVEPITLEATSTSPNSADAVNTNTNVSTYRVQINWTPNNVGKENTFTVKFLDPNSGKEIKGIEYDIMLFQDGMHLAETHRSGQQSPGAGQKYIFSEQGSYNLKIDNIGNTGASIDFPIHVVPEFPVSPLVGLVAGLIGTVIYTVRSKIRFLIH